MDNSLIRFIKAIHDKNGPKSLINPNEPYKKLTEKQSQTFWESIDKLEHQRNNPTKDGE